MNLGQFLRILGARWRLAFGVFASIVLVTLAGSLISPKQYIATATVVVDAKADPVMGTINPDQLSTSYLSTQVDIASSRVVAVRVVKALKLDEVSLFQKQWREATQGRGDLITWLANSLHRRLTITPSRDSNVISISMNWPDGATAAALANAFAKAYVDTTIELKVEPEKQYATWFDQRSMEMHSDLEAKQKQLSDFENSTGITATDQRLDIENTRLAELSSQLSAIQEQRQESESHQRQLQDHNDTAPEVLQSPLIASLKSDLARAEAKQRNIEINLGKNHPAYQTGEAEVISLRDRVAQETAKIALSLGNTTQINLRRENEVRAALDDQKRRVLELKREHDQLDVLQSDVVNAQHNLDTVTQRLAQSSLESQLQQTNVLLLSNATEPLQPSSPRLLMNMILGLFLGALLGSVTALVVEGVRPRVRGADDLTQLLSLPLLGRIRYGRPTRKPRRVRQLAIRADGVTSGPPPRSPETSTGQ
jgi:chain length determinant protein EpsF